MRPAIVVPAFEAARTIAGVVDDLRHALAEGHATVPIIVVDDGSSDATGALAARAGARVVTHRANRGKGAAIRTGLGAARSEGCDVVVTVDADGQHPAEQALRLLEASSDPEDFLLGVRDMVAAGAPPANMVGNRVANFFLSAFAGRRLCDTQCGLRRYPVDRILALGADDRRYGFEAEILLLAARARIRIVEVPVRVLYPPDAARTTHYRNVVDTIRIALRVIVTMLRPPCRRRTKLLAVLGVLGVLAAIHPALVGFTRMVPPPIVMPAGEVAIDAEDADLRWVGTDYARHRGKTWEVSLHGSPEEIGAHQVMLLKGEMYTNERELWSKLDQVVPSRLLRLLLFDIARIRFRHVDETMLDHHRREISAAARAFTPDPWETTVLTYQRFIYLHLLYEVSLSFERSPLIGCTSFALTGQAAEGGHVLLARTFDLDVPDVFDEHKAVFLVRESGRVPYASVAWPGFIGAVTGINEAGVVLVVHGARARQPRSVGQPVAQVARDVLAQARNTEEALRILAERETMVSHIVMLADPAGDVAIAERAPGERMFVRRATGKVALTNHFEGPWADDPRNLQVQRETSTLDRRARLEERLAELRAGAGVDDAIDILRDRRAPGGRESKTGDRRAIDASVATHAVVVDATDRIMWVSEGPHLAGRFVKFDIGRLLDPGHDPRRDHEVDAKPEVVPR